MGLQGTKMFAKTIFQNNIFLKFFKKKTCLGHRRDYIKWYGLDSHFRLFQFIKGK